MIILVILINKKESNLKLFMCSLFAQLMLFVIILCLFGFFKYSLHNPI